jgi:hypothetical protein
MLSISVNHSAQENLQEKEITMAQITLIALSMLKTDAVPCNVLFGI